MEKIGWAEKTWWKVRCCTHFQENNLSPSSIFLSRYLASSSPAKTVIKTSIFDKEGVKRVRKTPCKLKALADQSISFNRITNQSNGLWHMIDDRPFLDFFQTKILEEVRKIRQNNFVSPLFCKHYLLQLLKFSGTSRVFFKPVNEHLNLRCSRQPVCSTLLEIGNKPLRTLAALPHSHTYLERPKIDYFPKTNKKHYIITNNHIKFYTN